MYFNHGTFPIKLQQFRLYFLSIIIIKLRMILKLMKSFSTSSQLTNKIYSKGKSVLSIAQMIGGNRKYISPQIDNFYLKAHIQNLTEEMINNQKELLKDIIAKQQIVRCIISPLISQKDMKININSLKKNPILNYLIQLQDKNKYNANTPRIIINSHVYLDQSPRNLQNHSQLQILNYDSKQLPVHVAKHGKDSSKEQLWVNKATLIDQSSTNIKKNIVQLEKLFKDGLSLNFSYMISKKNLHKLQVSKQIAKKDQQFHKISSSYLQTISKKSKAINSNIVQNGLNFQQVVYSQGYQLHHVSLSSYCQKLKKIPLLQNNKAYNLQELIYVLSLIDFNGKLILDCHEQGKRSRGDFKDNIVYLQKILKEIGYRDYDNGDNDNSYISAL